MPRMEPMLAGKPKTLLNLRYPVLASPKLDGIRCLIFNEAPVSRSFISIPNRHITATIKAAKLPALDGELMIKGTFQDVTSGVMSEDGKPDFEYHVFDWFAQPGAPFSARYAAVAEFVAGAKLPWLKLVPHIEIKTPQALIKYEVEQVDKKGFEGIMLRDPKGPYKFGRSTEAEGYLLKVKRFIQEEAVIVGLEELESNQNNAGTDNFGRTKRSQSKGGMKKMGVLGSFICRRPDGTKFNVGTGFTAKQRRDYWAFSKTLIGMTITYKWQKAGSKDAPRFPVFIGFRDTRDMS